MYTKLISIDNQRIGTVDFYAYVVKIGEDQVGFALFMNDMETPLVCFKRDSPKTVNFQIDEEQFVWILQNSKFTSEERIEIYKNFECFLRSMEQKAVNYIFKDTKMTYVSNSRDLVRYKQRYIQGNLSII